MCTSKVPNLFGRFDGHFRLGRRNEWINFHWLGGTSKILLTFSSDQSMVGGTGGSLHKLKSNSVNLESVQGFIQVLASRVGKCTVA